MIGYGALPQARIPSSGKHVDDIVELEPAVISLATMNEILRHVIYFLLGQFLANGSCIISVSLGNYEVLLAALGMLFGMLWGALGCSPVFS